MKFLCDGCDKLFATNQNLTRHQKNSCKKLNVEKHICKYCGKTLSRQSYLIKHYEICVKKIHHDSSKILKKTKQKAQIKIDNHIVQIQLLEQENKKSRQEIKKLNEELEKQYGIIEGLKTAPDKKTIYNTAYIHPKLVNLPINNVPALTQEFIEQKVNDGILTYSLAARGYSGMLEVISELITHENGNGVIERNYVCTDVSRNSFHRLLVSKKWKSDKGGRYLNNMLDTFQNVMEGHKDKVYDTYSKTSHDSIEWSQVEWERKNISLLYSGVVCREGTPDREDLVNILRKEISKRASV